MGWFDRPEFGQNVGLIDEIYRRYLDDPNSVSEAWREFFTLHEPEGDEAAAADGAPDRRQPRPAEPAAAPEPAATTRERTPEPAAATPERPAASLPDGHVPLRGASARVVEAMTESLSVPTATSVRTVPARLLEVNRAEINAHLRRRRGGKVSFTHLIGYALVRALAGMPALRATYTDVGGRPARIPHEHVNLGLAVDVTRPDGTRLLLVPNVKRADTLDFGEFVVAYETAVRKVRDGRMSVEDLTGTTVTLTNPGTLGTVSSVPRLLRGQAAIIGVGAIGYPAEYQGADPKTLAEIGVGKVVSLTSTYDHRIIQGAESGALLARVHQLLLGDDGFYDQVFQAMGVPYVPVRWRRDTNPADELSATEKQARVLQLINAYRVRGHLLADLDPLDIKPPGMPAELDPATYGLGIWDLDRTFVTGGLAGARELPLGEVLRVLRDAYCRTSTCEYMHISQPDEKAWVQERMEGDHVDGLRDGDQARILRQLTEAEAFERFLHAKYLGHKRFSLEGAESLIPMLDAVGDDAAAAGLEEVVIGMAHRGRLNVLANTIGKSYGEIFHQFEGNLDPANPEGTGDVKYHLGSAGKHTTPGGGEIRVSVASNPSHLEAVNPVVEGIVRAKQDLLHARNGRARDTRDGAEGAHARDARDAPARDELDAPVLPLLIHGDAAFAGQGVVAETLNLSRLPGYRTGGTLHIVVNNQLGFTTSPDYGRSSTYATDVAKMIQAPIWHVNGDDPEACVRVVRLALRFRQAFGKDVVVDMWCYRRWGHNETDEPAFTQPVMYARIKERPSVRKLYVQALVDRGDLSLDDAERTLEAFQARLRRAFDEHQHASGPADGERQPPAPAGAEAAPGTGVPAGELERIAAAISRVPDDLAVHPKLVRWLAQRGEALRAGRPAADSEAQTRKADGRQAQVDWSLAEALAFGSLLAEGRTVRITGQDTRRGTFSHRHSVLVDQRDGRQYVPLANLPGATGRFETEDSTLSEFAAMGFEYGYTVGDPDALVLWEAQYGDFVNGAQVITDQFLVAAEDKWAQRSSLVLLLPAGYEGQGPEHSSARLERFLQLAAHDNVQVAVPTTAAQYFHLLRRQAHRGIRKPLVVMNPKSLLRLPDARSRGEELTAGRFAEILPDPAAPEAAAVRVVLLCSGKVYHDLARRRRDTGARGFALVRTEQLYPFPEAALREALGRYPGAQVRWVQEEPENMGAWRFMNLYAQRRLGIDLIPVTRDEGAAPATGSQRIHEREQAALLERAFAGEAEPGHDGATRAERDRVRRPS